MAFEQLAEMLADANAILLILKTLNREMTPFLCKNDDFDYQK
jgi:hypothetical protein